MEATAATTTTAAPSPLYKPLHLLTEDDIAQVTREDCRRFLKEKGMRRPSWNKSQAIQQVISLKALLEPPPPPDGSLTSPSPKRRAVSPSTPPPASAPLPPPPRPPESTPRPAPAVAVGPQMTIFYGGAVNVYDAMVPDKAVAIMKVAASRDALAELVQQPPVMKDRPLLPRPPPAPATAHMQHPPPHSVTFSAVGMGRFPSQYQREVAEDCRSSRDTEPEGPMGRRASLQRYLDKKKDRKFFKWKKDPDGLAPSDFELYLRQRLKPHVPFGLQCPNDTISLTPPLPPSTPTRSCFIENQGPTAHLPIDLNDDDVQEV